MTTRRMGTLSVLLQSPGIREPSDARVHGSPQAKKSLGREAPPSPLGARGVQTPGGGHCATLRCTGTSIPQCYPQQRSSRSDPTCGFFVARAAHCSLGGGLGSDSIYAHHVSRRSVVSFYVKRPCRSFTTLLCRPSTSFMNYVHTSCASRLVLLRGALLPDYAFAQRLHLASTTRLPPSRLFWTKRPS